MKKLIFVICAVLTAFVTGLFAQTTNTSEVQLEKFTIVAIVPNKEHKVSKVFVVDNQVNYEVELKNGFVRFTTDGDGNLNQIYSVVDDHIIASGAKHRLTGWKHDDGMRNIGTSYYDLDYRIWSEWFEKNVTVKIEILNRYSTFVPEARDSESVSWELLAFTINSAGEQEVVLSHASSNLARSIAQNKFAVLPRKGSKFSLWVRDGFLYPVENITTVEGKTLATVVIIK